MIDNEIKSTIHIFLSNGRAKFSCNIYDINE
jgi:hypothetical protein